MPAQLISLNDGPSIWVDKPILLVGRHPECDVQIDSRKVSRRHCCIAQVSDYLVVRDLGSTNGVRINGVRVLEGRLRAGDELTIGSHRYQISWDSVAESPPVRGRARETLRPPPEAVDDSLLESCDDPVPLADPRNPVRPPPKAARATLPMDDDQSLVLPERLDLAPSSEAIPRPPPAPG
jgi:predicted component of type VI protein secretion system